MVFLHADRRGLLAKPDALVRCSPTVLSEGSLPGGFLFCGRLYFSEVSHPQQYSIATRDTVVPMNNDVPTKYPLSHNDRIVFEIRLYRATPVLYIPALHANSNA